MSGARAQIVWFKRDLRVADHAPLAEAAARGAVAPVYIAEPSMIRQADYDARHWTFVRGSLVELRESLAKRGQALIVRTGEAVEVLEELARATGAEAVWAHEETGNGASYARDRAVRRWARERGLAFHELPSNGVVRRLKSRDGWSRTWEERMKAAQAESPGRIRGVRGVEAGGIPTHGELGLAQDGCRGGQAAGERAGWETLESFLERRGAGYAGAMSSPNTAWEGCSRLSPYLAYGNLSMRQVWQAAREARERKRAGWGRALSAFEARLHWHCHFIQKLEDEPRIEFENFVRAFDGLREEEFRREWFEAWRTGRTGYPMVDACMRCLEETGWINFRMRAMLMSFASYTLWLHWREPALHLARVFTDYEPGIHYSQAQMQAGTTGINTLRMYNPTKQAREQDAAGEFIRRWIPELRDMPGEWIHEPWRRPEKMGGYPAPIVDHAAAVAEARRKIGDYRKRAGTREEARRVLERHGSRKRAPGRRKTGAAATEQGRLF